MAHRCWTFVVNVPKADKPEEDIGTNPDLQEEGLDWMDRQKPKWDERTMQYLVYSRQRGSERKRLHWQGYVQFKAKGGVRVKEALKRLSGDDEGEGPWKGSLRAMKDTPQTCMDYIVADPKKTNIEAPVEYGTVDLSLHSTCGPGQGSRTDLRAIGKKIEDEKMSKDLVIAEWPDIWQRYNRVAVHHLQKAMMSRPLPVCSDKKELLARRPNLIPADEAIRAYLSGPSNRKIIWLYSYKGDSGKSELLKHWRNDLTDEKKDVYISTGGKAWDVARGYEGQQYVVIDCPRKTDEVPYGFMEGVLNGHVCSTKQYVAQWILKTYGHVIVGGNDVPSNTDMSPDRWWTICVDEAVPAAVGGP